MTMSIQGRKVFATALGVAFMLMGLVIAWLGQFLLAALGDALSATKAIPGFAGCLIRNRLSTCSWCCHLLRSGTLDRRPPLDTSPRLLDSRHRVCVAARSRAPDLLAQLCRRRHVGKCSAQAIFNIILVFIGSVVVARDLSHEPLRSRRARAADPCRHVPLDDRCSAPGHVLAGVASQRAWSDLRNPVKVDLASQPFPPYVRRYLRAIAYLKFRRETQGAKSLRRIRVVQGAIRVVGKLRPLES